MKRRFLALLSAASLLLSLTACGGGAKATTMHLMKTEGTVGVSDDGGKEIKPKENLGLYSGYGVDTQSESYAWIDLDEVKLTKMDQNSDISIQKEDKRLEIVVNSGNLFFNVTEPLAEDETMEIRTSSMVVGIRGTCGWVTENTAALLEGTVQITAGEQSVTITAGEMAVLTADGEIEVKSFYQENIPSFIAEEDLEEDVLSEVPPLYPLHVLTRQTLHRHDGLERYIVDYFYDEEGYALYREDSEYTRDTLRYASTVTYSYDGKENFLVTYSEGYTYEVPYAPGTVDPTAGFNDAFAAPMVSSHYDMRSKIGPDGRLDLDDTGTTDGSYAIYTMDADGYPVYIETYTSDGVQIGTAELEWAVIERPQ